MTYSICSCNLLANLFLQSLKCVRQGISAVLTYHIYDHAVHTDMPDEREDHPLCSLVIHRRDASADT